MSEKWEVTILYGDTGKCIIDFDGDLMAQDYAKKSMKDGFYYSEQDNTTHFIPAKEINEIVIRKSEGTLVGYEFNPAMKHAAFFAMVIDVLRKLAPEECPKDHKADFDIFLDEYCAICNRDISHHAPDCAWVEARKLLEEFDEKNKR